METYLQFLKRTDEKSSKGNSANDDTTNNTIAWIDEANVLELKKIREHIQAISKSPFWELLHEG